MVDSIHTYLKLLFVAIVFTTHFASLGVAQENTNDNPRGVFLKQEVKVGEPVQYVLTFSHPKEMEVLFPDSTYDFSPFEWIGQEYYPTRTDSLTSFDSVVYTFMTFELDSIQTLSVPVWEITGMAEEDKNNIFPLEDRVTLQPVIVAQPDSIQLQTNTTFLPVLKAFNYPYLLVALGILLVVAIIVLVVFGKPIRKAYRLRKMKREYARFSQEFEQTIERELSSKRVENALRRWKEYTAKMVDLPLYSYTSKEIKYALSDTKLDNSLSQMDKAIYAELLGKDIEAALRYLKEYAFSAYQQKVKEVKNA